MGRLIDDDALMGAVMAQDVVDKSVAKRLILQAPTVDAIPLDTKIVIQTYNEEHEEWSNEIMTIQEFLDSGMCEIYREELRDQYE